MPKNKKFNAEQMRLDNELKKERNELSRANSKVETKTKPCMLA
ncbi:hypothetical protein [Staphylococcus sp. FSL R7-0694]